MVTLIDVLLFKIRVLLVVGTIMMLIEANKMFSDATSSLESSLSEIGHFSLKLLHSNN